jgi:hypothetical protein
MERKSLARNDVKFHHLAHSFTAGLTARAGGFPALTLALAWAWPTTHTIAAVNPTHLGGSARPSPF